MRFRNQSPKIEWKDHLQHPHDKGTKHTAKEERKTRQKIGSIKGDL